MSMKLTYLGQERMARQFLLDKVQLLPENVAVMTSKDVEAAVEDWMKLNGYEMMEYNPEKMVFFPKRFRESFITFER